MPGNYPTSSYKKPKGKRRRYVVTYEENTVGGEMATFSVMAHSMSEATALTIQYIQENKNTSDSSYILYAELSREIAYYNINTL